MADVESERESELMEKRICRFCLSQELNKLTKLDAEKSGTPLSIQVMAIATIEIHIKDGMPTWICLDCCILFEHAYEFKNMCKRAEALLRRFPLTGKWPVPLSKPKIPHISSIEESIPLIRAVTVGPKKKILNSNPADSPEPPAPVRVKREKLEDETLLFLEKVDNDEELSMDDVQRLIAASDDVDALSMIATVTENKPNRRPKLLNKSSIRILNKEAEKLSEPRISEPQVKWDDYGRIEVVTEILDPNEPADPESAPTSSAATIETQVFPCPRCERSFPLRQLRDIHMVNHNRERSFQCTACDKSFFSKYDLQKHDLTHTGDRPFRCTICDKGFTRSTLLHRHEKTHADIPKYVCEYCEKPFISKDEMEKHTERHRKKRPFICEVCQKGFAFKQGLERHEVVHSQVQPYPCQYCDQSFSTPTKLSRHLTAHAGKRPYPCKFCNKSYLLSHHLSRHLRSHKQGVADFRCNDCEKTFNKRDELIFHSVTHVVKTLVCNLCKENLKSVDSVTAHMRQHAEGEAFDCEFCDMIFMTFKRLQKHKIEKHIDDMRAYQEHDKSKANCQSALQKLEANDQSEGDFQHAMDEILIDELGADVCHASSSLKSQTPAEVKIEENISKKPKILSQIMLRPKTFAEEDPKCDTSEQQLESAEPKYTEEDVPLKYRKTESGSSSNLSHVISTKDQAPSLRRKVAKDKMSVNPIIQIERHEVIVPAKPVAESKSKEKNAINLALQAISKSVSVRRNVPTDTPKASIKSTLPPLPQLTVTTRSSNKNLVTTKRITKEVTTRKERRESDVKTELSVNTNTSAEKSSLNHRKVIISKVEADALLKKGLICIKDGNMVFAKRK